MKHTPLRSNDFSSRNLHGHCVNDALNETCEKFFQIWSHKAVNISNDLIEYTIRRIQNDRLRVLFQTRNEFTHQENVAPICQMSVHTEDDLQRIKENIRCFCLSTRNVYRHLRSDSRLYPKMCIDLDQNIMIKICRFIFKTKVLIEMFSKNELLNIHDPYRNISKAFIVLQSNFQILYGDILERDFLQNEMFDLIQAVQTLPIILDTSRTIRLIFCALYKLSEPERRAEADAIRQRRLGRHHLRLTNNRDLFQAFSGRKHQSRNQEKNKMKMINEIKRISQSQVTHTSEAIPMKTSAGNKSIHPLKTNTKGSAIRIQSTKSHTNTPHSTVSKTKKNLLSPSVQKPHHHSSKKSSTPVPTKNKHSKSPRPKSGAHKKAKNQNASTIDSSLSYKNHSAPKLRNTPEISTNERLGWTTWLHNATLRLATIIPSNPTNLHANPSKPLLTTWASLDRLSK